MKFRASAAIAAKSIAVLLGIQAFAFGEYYKNSVMFEPSPQPDKPKYDIARFGPVGLGLALIKPNFTIQITNVEPGSPADATGKFKKGQIIHSVNGHVLKDVDPRILLGNWITEAEAKGGKMDIAVSDKPGGKPQIVLVKLQDLGAYSPTWPENCSKSDKIVRQFAEMLAKVNKPNYGAALFLMSTGEEKDLEVVRSWYSGKLDPANYDKALPWDIGYEGIAVCEYYLRTGDKSVLPAIEAMATRLKNTIYDGAWAGRGGAPYPYGQLNAAGVHCVTYLMMAKECGVKVDEETLQSSLRQFFRFAGKGNVAYGDFMPEGGFVDNGKTIKLAFAMEAAANLCGRGEDSVYAKARDISATKSFYSTSWLFHGHTGGGIGELWRGQGMNVVKDKRPEQRRSFMDNRLWMYELARTWDGAFGWVSGWNVGYADTGRAGDSRAGRAWGNFIPLIYTHHLKKLRLFGAPPTAHSKTYDLPERPWGTPADDVFLSMKPGEYAPGKSIDISKERLETHASKPLLGIILADDASDDTLLGYALHIDQGVRALAAQAISKRGRQDLALRLLRSADPRGRHSGLLCLTGMFKGKPLPESLITPEMLDLAVNMIKDPNESLWVKVHALWGLQHADVAFLAPHRDLLISYLKNEEWWLSTTAMTALSPLAVDPAHYKPVLAAIADFMETNRSMPAITPVGEIVKKLQTATPAVRQYALEQLGEAYVNYPQTLETPGEQDLTEGVQFFLSRIAGDLADAPGGLEKLFKISTDKFPEKGLPHSNIYLKADLSKLDPKIREQIKPLMISTVIPDQIEDYRGYLEGEAKKRIPGRGMAALIKTYRGIGVDAYGWKAFGPAKEEISWAYYSFDPPEKSVNAPGKRHRKVTMPAETEGWFKPDFDLKRAGWKMGHAPFGGTRSEKTFKGRCSEPMCGCASELTTLWEHEILMMHTSMELPPIKEDHAYALLIGGRSHAKTGDGVDVYINGKKIRSNAGFAAMPGVGNSDFMTEEQTAKYSGPTIPATPGRTNGTPRGFFLSDELREEVSKGKFTIAVRGFRHPDSDVGGRMSFWFEEMKIPEIPPKKE